MQNRRVQGFTLLELSIVLVIIGVLVGGVMLGKSMITASRLQTVMTDVDSYITATGNFKQQYQALPGDLATATTLWGTDSSGCPYGGGSTGTCNGNGDGMVGYIGGQEFEDFRFWQHLYLAGMFSKRLSGVATTAGTISASPGVDVPAGSIYGSGYFILYVGTVGSGGTATSFAGYYGHVFVFGSAFPTAATAGPALTADQAASIDTKMDDGLPATGKVRSQISTSPLTPNCTTSANPATALYNVSASGTLCSLWFVTGF